MLAVGLLRTCDIVKRSRLGNDFTTDCLRGKIGSFDRVRVTRKREATVIAASQDGIGDKYCAGVVIPLSNKRLGTQIKLENGRRGEG